MNAGPLSYALPQTVAPDLARVKAFWENLKRGEADIPFADDLDLSKLQELATGIVLVAVFDDPLRFRFEWLGQAVEQRYGAPLKGEFSDEVEPRPPLEDFTGQASATVARRVPTFFEGTDGSAGYSRVLLPTWGDGHVAMLLGAISDRSGDSA
jgi:hypothetical protein